MNPVRVLVVDDSATMRHLISVALNADPEIEEVVLRTDRFEMVRKTGVGAEVAARLDA